MESPELSRIGEKRALPAENQSLAVLAEILQRRVVQLESDVAAGVQAQAELRAALDEGAAERERMRERAAEAARVLETVRQQLRDAIAQRESVKAEWAALEATTAWKLTALLRGVQRFFFRQKRSLGKRWREAAHRLLCWAVARHPTKNLRELHRCAEAIRGSGLLEAAWYRTEYADRVSAKTDVVLHYLRAGAAQGCDPNRFFDTRWYLERNRDAAAGMNPLLHYLTAGWKEGRDPGPLFSLRTYLREHPEIDAAGREPLAEALDQSRKNPALAASNGAQPEDAGPPLESGPSRGQTGEKPVRPRQRICFVGDDADTTFLSLLRWVKANTNLDFRIVLARGGAQAAQFAEVAPVLVATNPDDPAGFAADVLKFCGQRPDLFYGNIEVAAPGIPLVRHRPEWDAPRSVSAIRSALATAQSDQLSQAP